MHLKLKIHLNARRGLVAGLLLALLAGWHRCAAFELPSQQGQTIERKCKQILNFGLPQAAQASKRSTSDDNQLPDEDQQQQQRKLSQSIPNNFSFSIGDIDLPLSQIDGATSGGGGLGSSVQSAMKLLAAFDSQLYGEDEDEEDEREDADDKSHQNTMRFLANKLYISGLNFTMLNVHLYSSGEPRIALGVNIENTTLTGRFLYDGPTPALLAGDRAKLAAHYRISIDNVLVMAAANLTKQEAAGAPARPSRFRLATRDLRVNLTNLGYISIDILDAEDASKPTSNYALQVLQRVLQRTIKRTYATFEEYIRRTLELEGRHLVDCELSRFSPLLAENLAPSADAKPAAALPARPAAGDLRAKSAATGGGGGDGGGEPQVALETATSLSDERPASANASTYLDDVARIISTEMANSRLSRIELPSFEYQRGVFGTSANINFLNGTLAGLDNIRLTGETRVKLLEEHLMVNASLGWVNLRPHYNWTLYFGGGGGAGQQPVDADRRLAQSGPSSGAANQLAGGDQAQAQGPAGKARAPMARGFVAFNIRAIDFDAVISKSVRTRSQMVVDELTIRRLDGPKMDIGGLPGMNRLTRTVVNFFMGRLKARLVGSIQPALKLELERALNRLALFN